MQCRNILTNMHLSIKNSNLKFLFQLESSAQEVHENLNSIIDYQTHHRLRETQVNQTYFHTYIYLPVNFPIPNYWTFSTFNFFFFQGRKRAEDLNERVMIWSFFVTAGMVIVGFTQVCVLKSFFSEKKPSALYGYH